MKLRTPKANRLAALSLLALTVILVIAAVAVPTYWAREHYDSSNALTSRKLNAYTTLNQTRPKLMGLVEVLRAKEAKKFFLKGATPALASAELQDLARTMIEASGGKFLSSQATANKEDSGYRQIGTKIQMSTNIQNLRNVLYALETREPYLFVDGLTVRGNVPPGFKPAPGVEPEMYVEFDLIGYASMTPATDSSTDAGAKT